MPVPASSPAGAEPAAPRWPDLMAMLPARLPVRLWVLTVLAFLAAYGVMFMVVHPLADTRPCIARIDDPLFRIVPWQRDWYYVTHTMYYFFTAGGTLALVARAVRGDHRNLVRFALGLTVQAALRSVTITLLPLCRWTVQPGTVVLEKWPMVDLGPFRIPWRAWATNDLVFSGHVGEFLLMTWCTRHWPRPARAALIVFQLLQAWGLLATRGHYTIDLVVAVPCAFLADAMALRLMGLLTRGQAARA